MNKALITLAALTFVACTDDSRTRDVLEKQGFTDVHVDGYAWMACSEDDHFATAFTAKNPQGRTVSGAVCCGAWKNCTVRW